MPSLRYARRSRGDNERVMDSAGIPARYPDFHLCCRRQWKLWRRNTFILCRDESRTFVPSPDICLSRRGNLLFLAIADILPIVSALNPNLTLNPNRHLTLTSYRPGGGETIWPVRPAAGPQSAYLWWPAVAKLQAASVPIA